MRTSKYVLTLNSVWSSKQQQLNGFAVQVYVRARPCADGQEPPEDMFERKKDSSKNIVIKVRHAPRTVRHGHS